MWFRRFSVEDKTTGIDLFKLDVKCITTYLLQYDRFAEESRKRWEKPAYQIVNKMRRVWEIINEVDTMDGNIAPIEGQGLNVRDQRRNKKSPE